MQLLQALRNATAHLEASFENSKLFSQSLDRGEYREDIIKEFLRPFLPKCYGLGSGEVFSKGGQQSRQIDVVIYDDVFSNALFQYERNFLFPCESVFGSIEVKSSLTTYELNITIENIRSLKSLSRESSDMMDLLPFRRLIVGEGLTFDESKRNPYLGILFTYDGISSKTVIAHLNEYLSNTDDKQLLPDFIFNHKKQYMVMRAVQSKGAFVPVPIGTNYERFIDVDIGSDILPIFYLTVIICLNQIILRAPDFGQYWAETFNAALCRT